MKKGKVLEFFPGANTYKGFISFYDSLLKDMNRTFIIKGGPGTGKSTFIKSVCDYVTKNGFDTEVLRCSGDTGSYDGLILDKFKIAIVDGTAPHILDPKNPGVTEEIINFGELWNEAKLVNKKDDIVALNSSIEDNFNRAYDSLKNAKEMHDDIEYIYRGYIDFDVIDRFTQNIIESTFTESKLKQPKVRHMFSEVVSHDGIVNIYEIHIKDIKKLYILKGGPGTGKSTLMRTIGDAAEYCGYNIDYFHCGLDPDSIDMIKIPQADFIMVDGSEPHVVESTEDSHRVIDLDKNIAMYGVNRYKGTLQKLKIMQNEYVEEAVGFLKKAKQLHDDLEKYYIRSMYFSRLDRVKSNVIEKIKYYSKKV